MKHHKTQFILVALITVIAAVMSFGLFLNNNIQSLQDSITNNKLILLDIQTNEVIIGSLYNNQNSNNESPQLKVLPPPAELESITYPYSLNFPTSLWDA